MQSDYESTFDPSNYTNLIVNRDGSVDMDDVMPITNYVDGLDHDLDNIRDRMGTTFDLEKFRTLSHQLESIKRLKDILSDMSEQDDEEY